MLFSTVTLISEGESNSPGHILHRKHPLTTNIHPAPGCPHNSRARTLNPSSRVHPETVQQPPACSAQPSRLSLREQTPSVTGTCAIPQRRETRVCRGAPCRDASLELVRSMVFPMDAPPRYFAKRQRVTLDLPRPLRLARFLPPAALTR